MWLNLRLHMHADRRSAGSQWQWRVAACLRAHAKGQACPKLSHQQQRATPEVGECVPAHPCGHSPACLSSAFSHLEGSHLQIDGHQTKSNLHLQVRTPKHDAGFEFSQQQ